MRSHDEATARLLQQAERLRLDAKHAEALAVLESIIVRNPENVTALEEIADNELSLGHFKRAASAAKRAVALDRESASGHYVLGFIASHDERWQDAIASLQEANRIEPNHPEILRCLGWALFSGGEEVQGTVTLERALNLEEENPLTLCDLGVVHLKLRHFDKATTLFERALEVDPTNRRAEECLEAVKRIAKAAGE